MNQKQTQQQLAYLRSELTLIDHELTYQEGYAEQLLRLRQARLAAELERLEGMSRGAAVSSQPVQAVARARTAPDQ